MSSLLVILCASTVAPLAAQMFTTLTNFNGMNGHGPHYGNLIQGGDGNFYGTTWSGGASGNGTVFRMTPTGILTSIHSFSGSDGSDPEAGLVRGTDGSFYGTTNMGGTSNAGTVFKITPPGVLTVLHSFNGTDGTHPRSQLVQATDGNLYGTTFHGGSGPTGLLGTVFKVTPGGTLTILHNFLGGMDGNNPVGGLVQANDGNFYGTTGNGGVGPNASGTIFRITLAGTLTTLYRFSGTDGGGPSGTLIQGADGNLYGTTTNGGSADNGTLFRITLGGVLTTLYKFSGSDGSEPLGALLQSIDGNFYGTTYLGGTNDVGTVFKFAKDGTLTTLHSFRDTDGKLPWGGLLQTTDGSLYGTTGLGGVSNDGTVFKLMPPTTSSPVISPSGVITAGAFGAFTSLGPGTYIEVYGANLAPKTREWASSDFSVAGDAPTSLEGVSLKINNMSAFICFISPGQVNALVPDGVGSGSVQMILTTAGVASAPYTINIDSLKPGLLAPPSFTVNGKQYVAGILNGGLFTLPANAIPGVASRAAIPGEIVVFYGIGFGPVTPDVPVGKIAPAQQTTLRMPLSFQFGSTPASILYQGLAPGFVGLYQFNVLVPPVPDDDAVQLSVSQGGTPLLQKLYIAIRR